MKNKYIHNKHLINCYNSAYNVYEALLESHNARVNLCSLKKKIGQPAGTNTRIISNSVS